MEREVPADASLGADKAAILFANSPRAFRAGLKTRRRRRVITRTVAYTSRLAA
jgi:hypothetical protein